MKIHLLFRASLLLFICCSLQTAKGQWVTIPDANFRTYLQQNFPSCMNGNLMDTSCPAVVNATSVDCSNKQIADLTGIQYFDNLQELYCSNNQLTVLPSLPSGLTLLDCSYNQLTVLPSLPSGLIHFYCLSNQLTVLPALPGGLTVLDCGFNQITVLSTLPGSIESLSCTSNLLTALPALPGSLIWLSCGYNQLTTLPTLPGSLDRLDCPNNQLTVLPALPGGLIELFCSANLLTALPALPNSLMDLNCGGNQLTVLPALPGSLIVLWCNNNQLTTLPALPDYLLRCHINGNPLTCLPQLKRIVSLNFSNTLVTCLPNYGNVTNSQPPLNSLPLCDVFNSNGCDVFWNISGKTYYDDNSNCIKDAGDTAQRNIKVQLLSGGSLVQQTSTGGEGFYSFDTDSFGAYEINIDTSGSPFYVSCPANNLLHDTLTAVDSFHYSRDFSLRCKPGFDLEARSIVADIFRPANNTMVEIGAGDATNFYGAHCAAGVSGAVTITFTGPVSYVSPAGGALTPAVSANTLTYSIADFGVVNFFDDFDFILVTDTFAQAGQQVCITVSVTPTTGDNNPANNILIHCFDIVNSYDPNDKQVYPAGDVDTAQEWLTYTVRFQNTGTAEAQHIYITDTLDSNIDVSSFQLLAYSHQPMVQIKENAVRFNYPNINLPDSNTNEPESHGYVQYKVKLKENLAIGTQINNTAFIYFDFNEPVITNTTTNTISVISGMLKAEIATLSFEMFPNPANDVVSVIVDEPLIGAVLTVSDITGRVMQTLNIEHRLSNIEVKDFSAGIYFVTISTSSGVTATKKLVVGR